MAPANTIKTAAEKNAIATGRMPKAVVAIAATRMRTGNKARRALPRCNARSANGKHCSAFSRSGMSARLPCSTITSPSCSVMVPRRSVSRSPVRLTASRLTPNRSNSRLAWADRPISGELAPITASMLLISACGWLASGMRWPDSSFSLPAETMRSSACGSPSRIKVSPTESATSGNGARRYRPAAGWR